MTPHVITHPDTVVGLTPKLNWMLAHLMDDEAVVFLDDDLRYMRRNFTEPHEADRRDVTDPAAIEAVIRETFEAQRLAPRPDPWLDAAQAIRADTGTQGELPDS